uniref:Uncharacterized protein n=1 Tax=Pavo cristatus TaxID=9049 RepID=A0A8C9FU64_PAVCR
MGRPTAAARALMGRPHVRVRLFGLCNNIPYVVMLSAAHDILRPNQVRPRPLPTAPSICCKGKEGATSALCPGGSPTASHPPLHFRLDDLGVDLGHSVDSMGADDAEVSHVDPLGASFLYQGHPPQPVHIVGEEGCDVLWGVAGRG